MRGGDRDPERLPPVVTTTPPAVPGIEGSLGLTLVVLRESSGVIGGVGRGLPGSEGKEEDSSGDSERNVPVICCSNCSKSEIISLNMYP